MDATRVRICDILKTEYPDFCAYCESSGKVFVSELSNIDFVAFRTRMQKSREYIVQLKAFIDEALLSFEGDVESLIDNNEPIEVSVEKEVIQSAIDVDAAETISEITEQEYPDNPLYPNNNTDATVEQESDKAKKQNTSYDKSVEYDEITPLFSIFEVDPNDFSDVSFDELYLSVRSFNCLNRSGCKSLGDLLLKTISDLKSIKNMGLKSVNEILAKVKEYVADFSDESGKDKEKKTLISLRSIELNESVRDAVESILLGESYSKDDFNEHQIALFDRIKDSVDVVGSEICMEAYTNPQYVKLICESFESFAAPVVKLNSIVEPVCEAIYALPIFIKDKKAVPFITAYIAKTKANLSSILLKCSEETKIYQLAALRDTLSDKKTALHVKEFISWINIDVTETIIKISSKIDELLQESSDKAIDILESRASGQTLEEIGSRLGLTRERVRQIEQKMYRKFWAYYNAQKYDLIMLAYALRDGDSILYLNELKEVLGDFALILWDSIKHTPEHEFYFYSKDIDAIIVPSGKESKSDKKLLSNAHQALSTLPRVLESTRVEEELEKVSVKFEIPLEVIQNLFYDSYKKTGEFYSQNAITVVFMCDYVLKNRFPAGFKTGDAFESDRFRQYMIEFFGERASSVTNRAIDAKVGEIGVLCDRGKYIHPDFLQVDEEIIEKINNYIEDSTRSLLTYGEIFDALAELLEGTQITNRYYLQGALKKYGCRFKTGRDFVRKVQNVSFVDELEAFVEDRGIVHKSEIFAEFTSLSEAGLGQVVARSATVFNIDNGYYIHASSFDIQPKDYKQIRAYLTEACADIPVNIRSVYDTVSAQFPDFMYRNDFDDRNKLFAALNYMFRDEFNFSRPYIAKLGVSDVTNKSVILQHIADYDQIEISELIDICEENNIRYVASSYLIQQVAPEFVRIDAETLMRRELTGITDESVDKAVEIITDMLEVNDYIVGAKIDDFLWYPQIELDWNEFLLENLIVQSGKVNVVYLIGDPLKHPNAVYVSDKYKDDTFDSMLIKILTDEVRKGSFMSKVEMRDWLKEEGFIEGKMPNFLESAKYFYVDGTGVHCADN